MVARKLSVAEYREFDSGPTEGFLMIPFSACAKRRSVRPMDSLSNCVSSAPEVAARRTRFSGPSVFAVVLVIVTIT